MSTQFKYQNSSISNDSVQFSISTQFSSIWPIDRTLSGATAPARVDLGGMAMKGYSVLREAPALLEHHYQIV